MGHYTRLATLAFRVFGLMIVLYAVPLVLFSLVMVVTAGAPSQQPPPGTVIAWALYALVGVVLLTMARPLARMAARGLDAVPAPPPDA